jgi:hypothetical protein
MDMDTVVSLVLLQEVPTGHRTHSMPSRVAEPSLSRTVSRPTPLSSSQPAATTSELRRGVDGTKNKLGGHQNFSVDGIP